MAQSYARDLARSARRHLQAAEHLLDETHRKDVAGYLYGIAAECAMKQMMINSGMRELVVERGNEDPFYAHFEELEETLVCDQAYGRLPVGLTRYAGNSSFMQHWAISMRYSPGKDIQIEWVNCCVETPKNIVETMDD